MDTGARTGGEPSGAHWDQHVKRGATAGGPGRYTNTGHGGRRTVHRQVGRCSRRAVCARSTGTGCGGHSRESTAYRSWREIVENPQTHSFRGAQTSESLGIESLGIALVR